jgi:triacylglycerol esterase/lipase EstA (alpha/beta hydrolase family)
VVIGLEFLWLGRANRAAARPALKRLVRAWAAEVIRGPIVFGWSQPFRRHALRDGLDLDGSAARGVVLVHGYFCNRAIWNGWLRRLRQRGIPHLAIDLEPAFAFIDAYADRVEAAVARMAEATGGRAPVVVAHSMGGLAVRAWLAVEPGRNASRVHRLFTIGSPHRGTKLARFARSANGRQMRTDSDFLAALAARETAATRARFICYWSDCDNVVFPSTNATLDGADNRGLTGWAHVHLVDHPAIFEAVLDAVAEPDQMS